MVGKLTGWETQGAPPTPVVSGPDRSASDPVVHEDQALPVPVRPKGNASRQAWVDYLNACGATVRDTDTRADLIKAADSLGL